MGVYDTLERHLPHAPDLAHAAVPAGMYLAWCANMHLVSADLAAEHERLLLRLRFGEARGSELFIACGGELAAAHLSAEGRAFTEAYYPRYEDDLRELFGPQWRSIADDADNYQLIARRLTARYMSRARRRSRSMLAGLGERWRALWR